MDNIYHIHPPLEKGPGDDRGRPKDRIDLLRIELLSDILARE